MLLHIIPSFAQSDAAHEHERAPSHGLGTHWYTVVIPM
jgi:hypothetical protein